MDRPAEPIDLVTSEDELRSLVVDIEDLVDWAAAAAPGIVRLRAALRKEHILLLGLTGVAITALALLVPRRDASG